MSAVAHRTRQAIPLVTTDDIEFVAGNERTPIRPSVAARDSDPGLPQSDAQLLLDTLDSAAALGLHTATVGALYLDGQLMADALHTWAERHGRDVKVTPLACGSIHHSVRMHGMEIVSIVLAPITNGDSQ